MPKYHHQQNQKNKLTKNEVHENFTPFLNFQLKNELTLGFTALWDMESNLQKSQDFLPVEFFTAFTNSYSQIFKVLGHMNEITTLMALLWELEKNYPAQPQKMHAEIQFIPIIEKYQREAQKQGIHFIFNHDIIENNVYGGKIEFEHILELLIANFLEQTEKGSIEVTLGMTDTKLCFHIKDSAPSFHEVDNLEPFKKNPSIHGKDNLSKIRIHITQKLVEKLKGTMKIISNNQKNGNEIRVEIPIKISEK